MNLIGSYKIIANGEVILENHNIVTLMGESFFLHRAVNNEFNPIKYILLGNSSIRANKNDLTLGNETVRKLCTKKVDLDSKQIILNCNCSVTEIENTSEIGVANDKILISHDIYELQENLLDPSLESVDIEYIFQLTTLTDRTDWKYAASLDDGNINNNIYYIYEDSNVTGVFEKNTHSGYHKLKTKEALKENCGAYFYDIDSKTLYVRTTTDDNPKEHEILIQT